MTAGGAGLQWVGSGKANAKMPGQAGHDSGRGWDDNRTTPLPVLSRLAASA